jgi:histidine phosphotransfer protein HptB
LAKALAKCTAKFAEESFEFELPEYDGVDFEAMNELHSGYGENSSVIIDKLIDLFKEDVVINLTKLADAARISDLESIKFIAHNMKSSCGSVGALHMLELFEEIENISAHGDISRIDSLITELQHEYTLVRDSLSQYQHAMVH